MHPPVASLKGSVMSATSRPLEWLVIRSTRLLDRTTPFAGVDKPETGLRSVQWRLGARVAPVSWAGPMVMQWCGAPVLELLCVAFNGLLVIGLMTDAWFAGARQGVYDNKNRMQYPYRGV